MKFAFVSKDLPPAWGGQPTMIYRLLSGLGPEDYCLISRRDYAPENFREAPPRRLPARYYHLPADPQLTRGYRYGLSAVRESANVVLGVVARARRLAAIMRREACEAVVACTGDPLDPPAAYLASRMAGVPFYFYVFDYYSLQKSDPVPEFFARRFEPLLARGAARVITHNEFLRDEYERRYRAKAEVIYNPCTLSDYETLPEDAGAGGSGIVYTGAIYEAHYDAFRNLVAALAMIGRDDLRLHVYSASPVDWKREGISGPVVQHGYREMSEVPKIQRQADILFLPLAFNAPYPELIRTSAPSKMGEYLAARRPVLVHAPADSFISWYFREHECGLVVDRQEPAELARAVERLAGDEGLRRRLSARAWERARADFSIAASRAKFAALLKLEA